MDRTGHDARVPDSLRPPGNETEVALLVAK